MELLLLYSLGHCFNTVRNHCFVHNLENWSLLDEITFFAGLADCSETLSLVIWNWIRFFEKSKCWVESDQLKTTNPRAIVSPKTWKLKFYDNTSASTLSTSLVTTTWIKFEIFHPLTRNLQINICNLSKKTLLLHFVSPHSYNLNPLEGWGWMLWCRPLQSQSVVTVWILIKCSDYRLLLLLTWKDSASGI